MDIDAVSSICPNCNILLVEDSGNADSDWPIGEQTAVTLGAEQISNSWAENADGTIPGGGTFAFPGVLTVASGGDWGYDAADEYPAALPGVLAAGGATLRSVRAVGPGRGFGESTWNQQGADENPDATSSGCDTYEAKPAYQTDVGCAGRAWDDLAAAADPLTGLGSAGSFGGAACRRRCRRLRRCRQH